MKKNAALGEYFARMQKAENPTMLNSKLMKKLEENRSRR